MERPSGPPAGDADQSPPAPASTLRRLRVVEVRPEAAATVSIVLQPETGVVPAPEPGAHIRVRLANGIERSYSLCNRDAQTNCYVIAVKREPASQGGSAAMHALRPGDVVEAAGPFNAFPVDWRARRLVLIAGGIGITPLFAMALEARRRGHDFELHYFARSEQDAAFAADLSAAAFAGCVHFHYGREPATVRNTLHERLRQLTDEHAIYVCGPRPLIDLTRELAQALVPSTAVYSESFGSGGGVQRVSGEKPFRICSPDGRVEVHVSETTSALQALLDAGVDVPYSCREGECGMCVLDVISGKPDHRDHFLNDEVRESDSCMAVCVSRAFSDVIVLDI